MTFVEPETDETDNDPTGLRKEVRDANKATADANARAEALERQIAFRDAGIDPKDAKQAYFVKGYDGDTDPDKIREAAVAAGFMEAPAEVASADELRTHAAIASASAGAATTPPDREAEYQAAIAQAKTPDQALAVFKQFGIEVSTETGNI